LFFLQNIPRCQGTLLYPQKLALISPTNGGHSVSIIRSRAKAMEFVFKCPHDSTLTFRLQQCFYNTNSNYLLASMGVVNTSEVKRNS
jgi:hypothetical protein